MSTFSLENVATGIVLGSLWRKWRQLYQRSLLDKLHHGFLVFEHTPALLFSPLTRSAQCFLLWSVSSCFVKLYSVAPWCTEWEEMCLMFCVFCLLFSSIFHPRCWWNSWLTSPGEWNIWAARISFTGTWPLVTACKQFFCLLFLIFIFLIFIFPFYFCFDLIISHLILYIFIYTFFGLYQSLPLFSFCFSKPSD